MSEEDEPINNGEGNGSSFYREQDRLLPVANVGRIMKRAVPNIAKVSKGAKESVQECVSEFIGFVTSEASDLLQAEKRKTITGDDLMNALNKLGFEAYTPVLQEYLVQFRTDQKTKKAGADGILDPNEPIKKTRGRKRKRPPSPAPGAPAPAPASSSSSVFAAQLSSSSSALPTFSIATQDPHQLYQQQMMMMQMQAQSHHPQPQTELVEDDDDEE
eukprot:TRINITY_DN56627_c0_g1_i1.p1 TRINITY_DN56627_c0_g1~~TRINITY_DN56627_c0_g1_i1.p1  ORF type:complete len:239 (-),score=55.25 TRINITY_DN56627_c0_g1_i1:200-847(-)